MSLHGFIRQEPAIILVCMFCKSPNAMPGEYIKLMSARKDTPLCLRCLSAGKRSLLTFNHNNPTLGTN